MNAKHRLAAVAASCAVAFGGLITVAPNAVAADSSACTYNGANHMRDVLDGSWNLRNGPGTGYYSKGLVYGGTDFYYYCTNVGADPSGAWYYGKVSSGANAGKKGWLFAPALYPTG